MYMIWYVQYLWIQNLASQSSWSIDIRWRTLNFEDSKMDLLTYVGGGPLPKMIRSPESGGSNIQPHPPQPRKSHVHNLWWAQYEKEGQREKGARRLARETEIKLRLRVIWKKDCLFSRCYGTARLNLFWTWIILTSPTAPYGLPLPCLNSRLLDCTAAWTPRFTEGDRGGFRRLTSGYIHWTKMKSANSSHIVT